MTVGTGTAGPHSNLVLGLSKTLEILKPDHFWLVPSSSADSIAVADLVREKHPTGFTAWNASQPYREIENPDSIADCRAAIAQVIRHVRTTAKSGDRLVVNPTSGTKQMSAGATLAALDEEVHEIHFTIGDRADGVVITGTERIESFNALEVFVSRDLRIAADLSGAGSHLAAHRLLSRYSRPVGLNLLDHQLVTNEQNQAQNKLFLANELSALALCLHEWERQNYEAARQLAASCNLSQMISTRKPLQELSQAAKTGKPHPSIVIDLLATGHVLHSRGDHEASIFIVCKSLESALRLRLMESTGLHAPYSLETLRTLPISPAFLQRCEMASNDSCTTVLGLNQIVDILNALGDPIAATYRADRRLPGLVRLRNEYTHALRHIEPAESCAFLDLVSDLFSSHLDFPTPATRPYLSSCLPD